LSQSTPNGQQKRRLEIEKRQQEKARQQKAADEVRRAEKLANLKAIRKAEQIKFDEESVSRPWVEKSGFCSDCTQMRIRHSNMLAMANFLTTKAEPKLVCQFTILWIPFSNFSSIINHGNYCPETKTTSRSRSPTQKHSSSEKWMNSIHGIKKKRKGIPLQKKKLTARLRRRWVSLKPSLHLFLILILLIFPLYKKLSPIRLRLRNRLRKSIMVRF